MWPGRASAWRSRTGPPSRPSRPPSTTEAWRRASGDDDFYGWLRIWQLACGGEGEALAEMGELADENPREVDLIVLWNCAIQPDALDVWAEWWPEPWDYNDNEETENR